jgi:hypothetical protein
MPEENPQSTLPSSTKRHNKQLDRDDPVDYQNPPPWWERSFLVTMWSTMKGWLLKQ